MKFTSFLRMFGDSRSQGNSRRQRGKHLQGRRPSTRLALEKLEDRTLLSILPPTFVAGRQNLNPADTGSHNTPSIAVNPANPRDLAMVYTRNDPAHLTANNQKVIIEGKFSFDGGASWISFAPGFNEVDPNRANLNPAPKLDQATDATIAFDRNNHFYFLYSEHNIDMVTGLLRFDRYSFDDTTQTFGPDFHKFLYYWALNGITDGIAQEAAINPTLVIDTSVPRFTDPVTGGTQNNPLAGEIYVAWNTNLKPVTVVPPSFNPNTIKILASFDQGLDFSTERYLNATAYSGGPGERDSYPRLIAAQGTASNRPGVFGRVQPGLLTAVWANFTPNNPPHSNIVTNRVTTGGAGAEFFEDIADPNLPDVTGTCNIGGTITDFSNGLYCDAFRPMMGPDTSADNSIPFNVDFSNFKNFTDIITGMTVTTDIRDVNMDQIEIRLVPPRPLGGVSSFILLQNHVDNAGMSRGDNPQVGTLGAHLGVIQAGAMANEVDTSWDGVFDNDYPRPINNTSVVTPRVGHFQPETNRLPTNFTIAQATGTWVVHIIDHRSDGTMNPPLQQLRRVGLTFTSKLANQIIPETVIAANGIKGAIAAGLYPDKPAVSPERGIGPTPAIAVDNTLGTFSAFQGRIYIAYTTIPPENNPPPDLLNISLSFSDDGGLTWITNFAPINDDTFVDGFSEGTRAQFQPEVVVDPYTGTLVVTFLDTRYDASRDRVVTTLTTSIDGGRSFNKQIYVDGSQQATDAITGKVINVQPITENQSSANPGRDQLFGFGDRQGLAVANGRAYPTWSGNQNGAFLNINVATAIFAVGPRIISSTMGPVTPSIGLLLDDGTTQIPYNSTYVNDITSLMNGVNQVDGFIITFDRPIDPASVTASTITVVFHDTVTPQNQLGTLIPVLTVTPIFDDPLSDFTNPYSLLAQQFFGAIRFLVRFAPQNQTGTYSYVVGPTAGMRGPQDRLRSPSDPAHLNNFMDQNANGVGGEFPTSGSGGDDYAVPAPANNGPNFLAPYDPNTLPIVIAGPHVVATFVNGSAVTADNLVLNNTVSSLDLVFDRDMDPTTLTGLSILRMVGPPGAIRGPFTILPDPNPNFSRLINGQLTTGPDPDPSHPRTYRVSFPLQQLSGTYTVTLSPTVRARNGDQLDTTQNAGVDRLRDTPSGGTQPNLYTNNLAVNILPNQTISSTINVSPVTDNFVIQGLTLSLDVTYFDDRDLQAWLIAPDGTRIQLFTFVGGSLPPFNDFRDTVLDDNARTPTGDLNPIQTGRAPFVGRYNPQQPLSALVGKSSPGIYQLFIASKSGNTGPTDKLNHWSLTLQKAVPLTGLGEPVADQVTASFRIFTLDKNNPLSRESWTAVGPASNNSNGNSGRVGGIAIDPSDPSGNTVFVAGASGGVWKTTNFLTNDAKGPVYVPLTDFAPTTGLNIGGIAVFGRNNDPRQSIVFVSTGEGDTGAENFGSSPGVGFLRSMDGGATWTLLDSLTNVDASGNRLPINSPLRDHRFVGTASFKVVVDPTLSTVTGGVIVYAALSGTPTAPMNGGIYRSVDSGDHWSLLQAGQATDVILAPNSGALQADGTLGNLRIVYAAFQNSAATPGGVYMGDSQGARLNRMTGGQGVLFRRVDVVPNTFVQVQNDGRDDPAVTPSGAKGRISLATPALIPSTVRNATILNVLYEGWLYAIVSKADNSEDGLYVTKDFGQNWTKILLANNAPTPTNPTNDDRKAPADLLGTQGNYDLSIVVDALDPNIVYVGGMAQSGLIKVDTTGMADARAVLAFNNIRNDAGMLQPNTVGPIQLGDVKKAYGLLNPLTGTLYSPANSPFINPFFLNLLNDPLNPFVANATLDMFNVTKLTNDGVQVKWIPYAEENQLLNPFPITAVSYLSAGTITATGDHHRAISTIDPLTGKTRLIFADDHGVFSVVDPGASYVDPNPVAVINAATGKAFSRQPQFVGGIGNALTPGGNINTRSRNGNLQITQFYGGAVQPSQAAADIAHVMFLGDAQDDGFPRSDPNTINNGNLGWNGGLGDGQWVATDQTGSGNFYDYKWPCCGGDTSNFFQFNDRSGRTFGLIDNPPDIANWPNIAGFNAAVNPIDGNQVVISSKTGKVFRTHEPEGAGVRWFLIGAPTDLDGTNAQALAYGAPDPADPTGALDNFIYGGTLGGKIFVTFNGGSWRNISAGLDGLPVQQIVTNPNRGSHEAFAVTLRHVYYMQDSSAANPTWQDITGNVFQITHNPFGEALLQETQLKYLTSLQADWRFVYLDNPGNPLGTTHPVLYIAGEGGVYRSRDKGQTWTIFPSVAQDGAPADGGYLANVHITHLDLALGNINPTTGKPNPRNSLDLLVATTFGRGSFAIRLQPPAPLELVFVQGQDGRVYGQKLDANGIPVGNYYQTSSSVVKTIKTGYDGFNNPEVFVTGGDDNVYAQRFDANGNPITDFFQVAPGGQSAVKSFTVGKDGNNNPELFAIGLNDAVYALKFNQDGTPNGGYFITDPNGRVKQITVGHDGFNRPELFAIAFDNTIYREKFTTNGDLASGFIFNGPNIVKSIAVGQTADGRPELFAIGINDNAYAELFDANGDPQSGGFFPVVAPDRRIRGMMVAHDANNNPELFVTGMDNQIYAQTFDANGFPLNGDYFFTTTGMINTKKTDGYSVAYDANNVPEIFAIGLDDELYYALFDANGRPRGPVYNPVHPGLKINQLATTH